MAFVDILCLEATLHAGHHLQHLPQRTHLLHRAKLIQEVLQVKGGLAELALHLLGLLDVHNLLRLLDEGEHVAHAEDAGGEPVRVEGLQRVGFLAHAHELHGNAGDGADGERRATACVAVHLGQNQPGQAYAFVEGGGGVDRLLACHGVDHQNYFLRVDGPLDLGQLLHELVVDLQPATGVDDGPGAVLARSLRGAVPGGAHRRGRRWRFLVDGNVELLAEGGELFDSCGAAQVGRDEHRLATPASGEVRRELGGGGRLAGPLESHEHERRCRRCAVVQPMIASAQDGRQLLVDHLNNLLTGVQPLQQVGVEAARLHLGDKLPRDAEVDVGLQKRYAHLFQRLVNILFRESTLAPKPLKYSGELFAKRVKHG